MDGTAEVSRPPLRVDCSYLITAWPSPTAPNASFDEHRLLGAVMRSLLRYSKIPRELLHNGLQTQEVEPPTTSLQPGHLQSLAEFWQALGGKPKAALNYTVTLGVTLDDLPLVPIVTDKLLHIDIVKEPPQ